MKKAVLFDFDGVLTTDATGSTSICNYISKQTGIELNTFKKEYYKYNDELLIGKITHKDIWQKLCDNLNAEINIEVLTNSFINTPIDEHMLRISKALKEHKYKIGMISDNKFDRIDTILKHYNLEKLFDVVVISANVGSGKDNAKIFMQALDVLNLTANECVFIDNNEKNLIVPNSMGMGVIHFDHIKRDFIKLASDLSLQEISL